MLYQTNYSSLHTALHHAIMSEEIFFHLHKFAWNSHIYLSIHYRIWTLNYPQLFSGYADVCVYGIDGDCGAIKILPCGGKPHVLCSYVTKSTVWLLKENWLLRRYLQDSFSLWTSLEGGWLLSMTLSLLCDGWELQIICHTWVRIPCSLHTQFGFWWSFSY